MPVEVSSRYILTPVARVLSQDQVQCGPKRRERRGTIKQRGELTAHCFAKQTTKTLKTAASLADEAKSVRQLSRMFNRPGSQQADSPNHAKAPSASQFGADTIGSEATAPSPSRGSCQHLG